MSLALNLTSHGQGREKKKNLILKIFFPLMFFSCQEPRQTFNAGAHLKTFRSATPATTFVLIMSRTQTFFCKYISIFSQKLQRQKEVAGRFDI